MRVRSAVRTTVTVLGAAFGLVAATAPAAGAPDAPTFTSYVALGDSFTAGPLVPPTRLDPLGCGRSGSNFASLLAKQLQVRSFTDVSCSGAATRHMTSPQEVLFGPNRPQFDALRPDTDLVTVTLGGNDYPLFSDVTQQCPSFLPIDPIGAPCEEHFTGGGSDPVRGPLPAVEADVTKALMGIKERSPHATVLLIGYPRMLPEQGYCQDVLPFSQGDYRWADSVERAMNETISRAADRAGVTYVDTYGPSAGHDACAPKGQAWVNGKGDKPFVAAAYHPLPEGMRGVAGVIADFLGA